MHKNISADRAEDRSFFDFLCHSKFRVNINALLQIYFDNNQCVLN